MRYHWFITRPKRSLTLIVDCLRAFMAVSEGRSWWSNGERDLQLQIEFENVLEKWGLKRIGQRRDRRREGGGGGGGRTYATWLYSYGLWFQDLNGMVRPTIAGQSLINGEPPVPIMTKQLLNFQYPSPYSRRSAVNVHPDFRIFPYRFLLKFLLDERLGHLTQSEIARFVVTKGTSENRFEEIVKDVLRYRGADSDDRILPDLLGESYQSRFSTGENFQRLEDVANTFLNAISFLQLTERPKEGILRIPHNERNRVESLLREYERYQLLPVEDAEIFQRSYGVGFQRDDRRDFSGAGYLTTRDAETRQVLLSYYELIAFEPVERLSERLYQKVSNQTSISVDRVRRIIEPLGTQSSLQRFEEKFLELSFGGGETATPFEKATASLFGEEGLGFKTLWIGSKPRSPDVLAISLETDSEYLGIIDTKASSQYTLARDHQHRMVRDYIPSYRIYSYEGHQYELRWFMYVAGGFSPNTSNKIREISSEAALSGSFVTAQNCIGMLRRHKRSPFSKQEFLNIFTSNREVTSRDF